MKTFLLVLALFSTVLVFAQAPTSESKSLENWLPESIAGYKVDGPALYVPSSPQRPYTMSSKVYKNGASTLTIVVFDYKQSPDLLKKYTVSWPAVPSDSQEQTNEISSKDGLTTFLTVHKMDKICQSYVNVRDRYLLYLTVNELSPELLKAVVSDLQPTKLP